VRPCERQTDRQADRQTDRQADRQTDRSILHPSGESAILRRAITSCAAWRLDVKDLEPLLGSQPGLSIHFFAAFRDGLLGRLRDEQANW
jgi:CRP-like cAMP-binding protein